MNLKKYIAKGLVADITLSPVSVYKSGGIEGMRGMLADDVGVAKDNVLEFWPVECGHNFIVFRVRYLG